ncbi:MAG: hypothetical protein H7Z12_08395 [Rhodospirillaceae bacterium]|nr:hypothetical protein [Rhodospirillales bacterium]
MTSYPMQRPGSLPDDSFFTLGAPVGPDQPNRREDVIKVETVLGNTGHHDILRSDGPIGYWGERQENAVKSWQEQNGLKVDGLLKPGGPTITSMKQTAGGLLSGFKPATPDEVDEHHGRLHQGEPGLLNTRPARLSLSVPADASELDEQTLAFNTDSARALTRSTIDGQVPSIYANYVKQAGNEAHPTIINLVDQVNESSGRDRAERVLHGIVGQLPADQAKALLGSTLPAQRPLGVRVADLADDNNVPLFRNVAAAAAEAPKETPTQTAPAPAKPEAAPTTSQGGGDQQSQQVAYMDPKDLTNGRGRLLEGGGAFGGGGAAGGAVIGGAILGSSGKPQGQNTTTQSPPVPTTMPGQTPDAQPQPGTPPSTPPKPIPPNPPPSLPQKPPVQGNTLPGRPAQPIPPEAPLEINTVDDIDHGKGGAPHPETQKGLDMIPNQQVRDVIKGKVFGSGVTNGADDKATNLEGKGSYDTAKQDQAEIVRQLGLDPASIGPLGRQPGTGVTTADGRVTVVARPLSGNDLPTLEVQVKDEKGNVLCQIKRRYKPD